MLNITWPMALTLSRIALTPYIVQCIASSQWGIATGAFIIAALTDIFDGALARHTGQETEFGIYLDPLADKILITSCYAALLYVHGAQVGIPPWLLGMVIAREAIFVAGAILLYLYAYTKNVHIQVSIRPTLAGKLTTTTHCIILGLIYLAQLGLLIIPSSLLYSLALIAAVLMALSSIQYGIMWKDRLESV